jgi:D-serine deaminase-like pyridoxal phosphate-dependent protein
VLELGILKRNLARMADAVSRHPGLKLRPHMKTAKSLAVAALAAPDHGPITVSTIAEARYFAGGGYRDQIYAVGITPQKLDSIAAINAQGNDVKIITDDLEVASAIAVHPGILPTLIEVDCGEGRGGIAPDSAALAEIARRLGVRQPTCVERLLSAEAGPVRVAKVSLGQSHAAAITGLPSTL